jgi:hypothetical protein
LRRRAILKTIPSTARKPFGDTFHGLLMGNSHPQYQP